MQVVVLNPPQPAFMPPSIKYGNTVTRSINCASLILLLAMRKDGVENDKTKPLWWALFLTNQIAEKNVRLKANTDALNDWLDNIQSDLESNPWKFRYHYHRVIGSSLRSEIAEQSADNMICL